MGSGFSVSYANNCPYFIVARCDRQKLIPIMKSGCNIETCNSLRDLIKEYPLHTICLSDGSKSNSKTAYAYSINGALVSHRIRNTAFVSTAELMASLPASPALLISLPTVNSFSQRTRSFPFTPSRISILQTPRTAHSPYHLHPQLYWLQITFAWIPSHIGFPEHKAVASLFPQVSNNSQIPAANYKNHYPPLSSKNSTLAGKISPITNSHY